MRIGCSGPVSERSGIGIAQKYLYPYLRNAGHELIFSEPRDVGMSPIARIQGLVRGWRPAHGPVDAYLSAVPPLPFGVKAPLITIIYDLRWLRTRSAFGARYRAWDLRRTVAHSDALLCISENTRQDLIQFDPRAAARSKTQWLGPGQIPENSFQESRSGLLMLVGGAAHKRNEHAAEALAIARPSWVRGVIGVGVSEVVRSTLAPLFPCEWFDRVSDTEILALYQRAEFFMMLGTDEGFGLPFVEALKTGCQVIATDHPLGREIVGSAGLLLRPGDAAETAKQLVSAPDVPPNIRVSHAAGFSWNAFGNACEAELLRITAGAC